MKQIMVLTSARADYGLLSGLIKKLASDERVRVRLVVTGMHLSPEFGLTYKEIEKDGIKIDRKIEILMSSDTPVSVSKTMGMAMISFADYIEEVGSLLRCVECKNTYYSFAWRRDNGRGNR